MEEDYVTFTPDMTEHDEDELMEDAARGGERLTRATVPPPKADVAKAPQPRDSSTGKYKSVAVALEDTLGALVELAAEHRVKLGELAVAQSALKKHEQRAARRDASNLKQLQEQKDKVVSVQAKADKNTAAAAATHEKERKRLQGDLNKAMRAAAAAEAAKEGAELRAGREATLRVQAERRQESAEKAVEKEKEKRVAEVGKASAAVERFRVLKNQANERARARGRWWRCCRSASRRSSTTTWSSRWRTRTRPRRCASWPTVAERRRCWTRTASSSTTACAPRGGAEEPVSA